MSLSKDDYDLIARISHAESSVDGPEAGRAVVDVILNRLASPDFPNTVRGVVSQSHVSKKTGNRVYQFEPVKRFGSVDSLPAAPANWRRDMSKYAGDVLTGQAERVVPDAFFFQNRDVTGRRGTRFAQEDGTAVGRQRFSSDYAGRTPRAGNLPAGQPHTMDTLPQDAPREKLHGEVSYANQGAIRNQPITEDLKLQLEQAAVDVYGPGSRVEVYSGGQPSSGPNRTGSVRHNNGRAADVRVYTPDGAQVRGDALAPIGQYWAAKKFGGVGMEMNGGGVHLDEFRTPPPGGGMAWNYARQGGAYTPVMEQAMAAGLSGQLPQLYAPEQPQTGMSIMDGLAAIQQQSAPVQPVQAAQLPDLSGASVQMQAPPQPVPMEQAQAGLLPLDPPVYVRDAPVTPVQPDPVQMAQLPQPAPGAPGIMDQLRQLFTGKNAGTGDGTSGETSRGRNMASALAGFAGAMADNGAAANEAAQQEAQMLEMARAQQSARMQAATRRMPRLDANPELMRAGIPGAQMQAAAPQAAGSPYEAILAALMPARSQNNSLADMIANGRLYG
ncbi:cell wall hydrolase [uncultured Cohaesibacter sp.]|uniref:cell wall hydrolase n=1 Tax=uncultured Cohaesibacter sp. TaxID=1002546 RepID=UPI0029C79CB0|nr:cell wall hydrolase [uncultured Cohaesibacter sp.]